MMWGRGGEIGCGVVSVGVREGAIFVFPRMERTQ